MHIWGWIFLDFSSHLSTKEKGMGETRDIQCTDHWTYIYIKKKKKATAIINMSLGMRNIS